MGGAFSFQDCAIDGHPVLEHSNRKSVQLGIISIFRAMGAAWRHGENVSETAEYY
jgi:hypothetical protein